MIDQLHKAVQKSKQAIQTDGTVSCLYAGVLLDYLHSIHINPATLFEPAILAELNESGGTILISQWQMLLEQAINYTDDVDLPLKVAEKFRPKHFGMLGFIFMSCRTLGEIADILWKFGQLIAEINDIQLIENGDYFEAHWIPHIGPLLPTFMKQSLVAVAVMAREITSTPTIKYDVHFTFPQPDNIATYQRIFGGKIYFDAPMTKLVAHKSILDLPIALSDPATNSVLLTQVEKKLQAINQSDFLQQVREYLTTHLASNKVTINDVATAFGMSPRTVQNRLTEFGYGYRALLEQIRQEQAEHYLSTTDLSLNDIADLLGYSEQSPFQNAFRRWTGESPGSFRKKVET